jgi:hypothetical protein
VNLPLAYSHHLSLPDFNTGEQERQAQLCMSIFVFLHCRLFCSFDIAKIRFLSHITFFCVKK